MAGPFPGMDPYLEFQAVWADFHNSLIAEIRNELGARLPDSYVARVEERIEVATYDSDPPTSFRPDVVVGRHGDEVSASSQSPQGLIATLEPRLMEILDHDPEELRITWVEIRSLPDLELITAVEILSPINKAWQGRRAYLDRRDALHAARINLVEIDLLWTGPPLPMKERIAPGAYYAIVARGDQLPVAAVYRWSVRDVLPRLPIPLRQPDPDVVIELGTLVSRVYDLGRYSRTLRRGVPLPEDTALAKKDRVWVESVGRPNI